MGHSDEKSTVPKLRDQFNWHEWHNAVVLALHGDGCLDIAEGTRTGPTAPVLTPKGTQEDAQAFNEREKEYKIDIREHKLDVKAYGKAVNSAFTKLTSYLEAAPQTTVKDLRDPHEVYEALKAEYEPKQDTQALGSFLKIVNNSIADHKNMTFLLHSIRKEMNALKSMGKELDSWVVVGCILNNLPDPYTSFINTEKFNTNLFDTKFSEFASRLLNAEASLQRPGAISTNLATETFKRNAGKQDGTKSVCKRCKDAKEYRWKHKWEKCFHNPKFNGERPEWFKKKLEAQNKNEEAKKMTFATQTISQAYTAQNERNIWLLDSGSQDHITNDLSALTDITPSCAVIQCGNKSRSRAEYKGKATLHLNVDGEERLIELTNVQYIPGFATNLVSYMKLREKGVRLEDVDELKMTFQGKTIAYIDIADQNLPTLRMFAANAYITMANPTAADEYKWHRRFGHMNYTYVQNAVKMVKGMEIIPGSPRPDVCHPCLAGKQHREMNKHSTEKANDFGDLITSDLMGGTTMTPTVKEGAHYVIVFTDYATKVCWVRLIKMKSEAAGEVIKFIKLMKNSGSSVRRFRSDGGTEYHHAKAYCDQEGIMWTTTQAYAPDMNGSSEKANKDLMTKALALLQDAHLPKSLWGEAIKTVCYLKNRSPSSALGGYTPYEKARNEKPDVSHFRVFGSLAYTHVPKEKRTKLMSHTNLGVFVGYTDTTRLVRIYNPASRTVKEYRDVVIDETKRWNDRLKEPNEGYENVDYTSSSSEDSEEEYDKVIHTDLEGRSEQDIQNDQGHAEQDLQNDQGHAEQDLQNDQGPAEQDAITPSTPSTNTTPQLPADPEFPLRSQRSQRTRRLPQRYDDWAYAQDHQEEDNATTTAYSRVYAVKVDPDPATPRSFYEAIKGSNGLEWRKATQGEFDSLIDNMVFILVDRPTDYQVLSGKWVFKIKRMPDGSIGRYKARWVVRGFEQDDYDQTFASTVRMSVVKWLLAYTSIKRKMLRQIDFITAFLNSLMTDKKVYVEQVQGYEQNKARKVCLLLKALYGLKEAPALWEKTLREYMIEMGFIPSPADPCLYYMNSAIIAVFVDDVLISGGNIKDIDHVVALLGKQFNIKDLGYPKHFLGISITRSQNGTLWLSQEHYLRNVLARFNMEDVKIKAIPMNPHGVLQENEEKPEQDHKAEKYKASYASAIGALMWAALSTRPDIAYAVGKLARYTANPGPQHFAALIWLFGYIKKTVNYELAYPEQDQNDAELSAYSDTDWAGCLDTRRSTGGYLIMYGNCLFSWKSKRQSNITRSSTEAEYVQLSDTARELVSYKRLHEDYEKTATRVRTTTLYGDNQGSISMALDANYRARTRHIDVHHHYVREAVEKGMITLEYVNTKHMLADVLTKPLAKSEHARFTDLLGVRPRE